uniref:Carboxylesterase type B domain-containing protein n=2 Tax=Vespula pensylvanica TaxID=30213 RepID=A0A834PE87_VESPE|nr:hypothetical protein H0235_000534 [Vespula pensylvanica]
MIFYHLPKDGEDTELKAVLYWIYGGSFLRGVASKFYYSPDYLIEEDIVVVTVNYRLGALGFLALQHQNATGNAGLKDQNLGLRWVRDNIAKFGGDPNKVTIAGVGAGSVSVGYHILSEKSKGLFRSSILMNGVPLNNWAFSTSEDIARKAYELAKELGSTATNDDEFLKFYYQVDVESLTRTVTNSTQIDIPLTPTLENPNFGPGWFITKCVLQLFGNHNRGPYMIGYNNDETITFAEKLEDIRYYINESVPLISEFKRGKPEMLDIEKDITNASIYKIIKELEYVAPIDFTQKLLTNFNDSIYYYRYDFGYNKSLHDIIDHFDIDGETRADEIKMIFYSELFQVNPKENNSMTLLQRRMTRLWTNFVKYGNPTPDGTNDPLLNIVWPDSRKSGEMLWLNDDLSVHDRYKSVIIDVAEVLLEFFSTELTMKRYNLPLFSVFLLFDWSLAAEFSPVIETTKGPVKGLVLTSIRESKKYHSYRGIPYGKPPVGYLRFRAPVEVDPWTEEFDATKDGPICPQIYKETFVGQEDCLNLNVYTPQVTFHLFIT